MLNVRMVLTPCTTIAATSRVSWVFLPATRYAATRRPHASNKRSFRQQHEKPLESTNLQGRLLRIEAQAILIHGACNRSPDLHKVLRGKIQHFIPPAEGIERSFG